jgi:hypothetical protein
VKWLYEYECPNPHVKRTREQSLAVRRQREKRLRQKGLAQTPQARARTLAQHYRESIKADKCERCGSTQNLEMHHRDYNEPYEVNTLCSNCHKQVERAQTLLVRALSNSISDSFSSGKCLDRCVTNNH